MSAKKTEESIIFMDTQKCKICRRQGQKLFLRGERCFSPKCAFVKRPFPPGPQKKRRGFTSSEYSKELKEKQKLKNYYGLGERQFRNYVKAALEKRGKDQDATLILIQSLESRLDNVIFRLGLAKSRRQARQLVSHGHFLVDKKPVNIASFEVKKNMEIALKESKKQKGDYKTNLLYLKNYRSPGWLRLDIEKMSAKVVDSPTIESLEQPMDISAIFEFYSR